MLFGESTDYDTACALLDQCMSSGVNFFDTAEMYPVPQRAETHGLSEVYLGRWLKQRLRAGGLRREEVVVATKVAGPSGQMTWIRGGPHSLDGTNITAAIDGSLQRLGLDYIDLIQLHWPDRCACAGHARAGWPCRLATSERRRRNRRGFARPQPTA